MKLKISILLVLCVAILLPNLATAQEFAIFAKQKVVVADIRDMNDRHLSDGVKQCIRQGIIDACTKSSDYEVYEINIEDVKRQLTASGQKVGFPTICNAIGKRADYIIFTNVKLSSSEVGAQNITIYITSSLYRIATGSEMKTRFAEAAPTSSSILSATSKLVSELLGINISAQSQSVQGIRSSTSYQQQYTYSQTPQSYVENANCGLNMKMVYVEGGTFQMGDSDELPVHSVTLDSYYVAECEVTQAQWQKIMGTTVYQQHDKANSSRAMRGVGDNNPMYYVSWEEAQAFCRRLGEITGKTYILPTEAMWEYAARGGKHNDSSQFSGHYMVDVVGWYDSNSGGTTHPVKQKRPNKLGLYDMTGNVWEWCSDWYSSSYYSSSPQNNPTGPSSGSNRVVRGGCWYNSASRSRVAFRGGYTPWVRDSFVGFRVVCLP